MIKSIVRVFLKGIGLCLLIVFAFVLRYAVSDLTLEIKDKRNDKDVTIVNDFYYNQLNDSEKYLYRQLEYEMPLYSEEINFKYVNSDERDRALDAFKNTNPKYYFLNDRYVSSSFGNSNKIGRIKFEITEKYLTEINDIEAIASQIINECPYSEDIDIIKYLHDWIINNVSYNHDGNSIGKCQDMNSALLDRSSVCSGYANAFAYLCQKMGYECYYVTGTADDVNNDVYGEAHAWNLLHLNDNWYWIDTTFDETMYKDYSEHEPRYDYFMVNDEQFLESHHLNDDYIYPNCE